MDVTPLSDQPSTSLPCTENSATAMDFREIKSPPSLSHHPTPVVTSFHPTSPVAALTTCHSNVYDLCIVGAGMIGSAAARHASAHVGVKICLVGPEEPSPQEILYREILGSYYDEGRLVNILHNNVSDQILTKNSIKRYRELEKLSGIDFYHPVGYITICTANSSMLKKKLQAADAGNLSFVDLSYNDIFERRFPYIKLKSDDHPLLDDLGAGYVNPRNMVAAQKIVARNQGCDIIDDMVHEVKPLVNGVHEVITENKGVIKAKRILICTGAFTNFINFSMPKLQINISKETAALLKVTLNEARRLSGMPSITYYCQEEKIRAYILPPILYPDGHHYLKIGHDDFEEADAQITLEELKNWFQSEGDPQKLERLSKFLINMLPGLKYEEITAMACIECNNRSRLPYIDRVSPTVTVAVVGNGLGAMNSEEIGRIAASLSLSGKWESELPKSHFQVIFQS